MLDVVSEVVADDAVKYADMSVEEYTLVKPTKMEKAMMMTDMFTKFLETKGSCGNCTEWQMEASEIIGATEARRLDVGLWKPVTGQHMKDDLLPHVKGGMRGRTITVGSLDVSFEKLS